MRKTILISLFCVVLLLSGCGNADNSSSKSGNTDASSSSKNHSLERPEVPTGDTIVIKDKLFIAQTNDIYYNPGDYLGKTIQYEGIFDIYEVPETGQRYYTVIRYGPGCCGIDANAGFEVVWNNRYPKQDDWVEAVGVLEEYIEDGSKYLRLALSSLTVMSVRGQETVAQ